MDWGFPSSTKKSFWGPLEPVATVAKPGGSRCLCCFTILCPWMPCQAGNWDWELGELSELGARFGYKHPLPIFTISGIFGFNIIQHIFGMPNINGIRSSWSNHNFSQQLAAQVVEILDARYSVFWQLPTIRGCDNPMLEDEREAGSTWSRCFQVCCLVQLVQEVENMAWTWPEHGPNMVGPEELLKDLSSKKSEAKRDVQNLGEVPMLSMSVPPWSSLGWIPVVIVYRCIFNQRYIVSFMHMYWSLSLLCIYVCIYMYTIYVRML